MFRSRVLGLEAAYLLGSQLLLSVGQLLARGKWPQEHDTWTIDTRGGTNDTCNRPRALYRLIRKTHTRKNGPRMGFFVFGKAPTGPL